MQIIQNKKRQVFEFRKDGQLAELNYRLHDGKMYFMKTKVPEALGGQGVGSALVKRGLQFAGDNQLPIVVYCTFTEGYLGRHPEYQDLIFKG